MIAPVQYDFNGNNFLKKGQTRDGESWLNHDLINPFVID